MQAANTGLTAGSTPIAEGYERDAIIINTLRIKKLFIIRGGQQVICLSGCTLHQLERALSPLGREPHSVIGSSCIGASVIGGVCNNSGGALLQRGPTYTQMALFARLDDDGVLRLINHLGVKLEEDPERMLNQLDQGTFSESDILCTTGRIGSDHAYADHVRKVDDDSPARFNADPRRLFEASGSAGKLSVFAVRLDTFPTRVATKTFYIGTNNRDDLTQLRRTVLESFRNLPVAAEYVHRDAYDMAACYGKDTFLLVRYLGTAHLQRLLAVQSWIDNALQKISTGFKGATDRTLNRIARLLPHHLPFRMTDFRDRFEHHLLLKMADDGIDEARSFLRSRYPNCSSDYFECTASESDQAFLHRFVVAGAAVRYSTFHANETTEIVAMDVALRRNDRDWFVALPDFIEFAIKVRLNYGHFFCHVFHQDYVVRKGHSAAELKANLCRLMDLRRAEYPAEHNVGHLYVAKPALESFYRSLDPCNSFNPGIGATSSDVRWGMIREPGETHHVSADRV